GPAAALAVPLARGGRARGRGRGLRRCSPRRQVQLVSPAGHPRVHEEHTRGVPPWQGADGGCPEARHAHAVEGDAEEIPTAEGLVGDTGLQHPGHGGRRARERAQAPHHGGAVQPPRDAGPHRQ
ncbi:unnamed protein product, partial [Prorocentrum cordatum]